MHTECIVINDCCLPFHLLLSDGLSEKLSSPLAPVLVELAQQNKYLLWQVDELKGASSFKLKLIYISLHPTYQRVDQVYTVDRLFTRSGGFHNQYASWVWSLSPSSRGWAILWSTRDVTSTTLFSRSLHSAEEGQSVHFPSHNIEQSIIESAKQRRCTCNMDHLFAPHEVDLFIGNELHPMLKQSWLFNWYSWFISTLNSLIIALHGVRVSLAKTSDCHEANNTLVTWALLSFYLSRFVFARSNWRSI